MYSLKSISLTGLMALLLLVATAACSVETREERQQRLFEQAEAPAAQAEDTTEQAPEEMAASTDPLTGLVIAPDQAEAAGKEGLEPVEPPDQDVQEAQEALDDNASALDTVSDAASAQDPAEAVRQFFHLALDRDLEGLKQYVTRDQQAGLEQLLADLDEAMNQEGDGRLLDVGQVDVLQTTRTAVVDVNVTLRFAGGDETRGESLQLRYEDGAWRISDVDF